MKIEQDYGKTNKKSSKTTKIIAILIVVTIAVTLAIIFIIWNMQNNKLIVRVDNQPVKVPEDTFVFAEDRKSIYIYKRYCCFCWIYGT